MLIEKTINIREAERKKRTIDAYGTTYNNGVLSIHAPNHGMLPGGELYMERACGDGDVFRKAFTIYDVDRDTIKILYDIDNYTLSPISMFKNSNINEVGGEVQDFLVLAFSNDEKHICCKDRTGVNITQFYDSGYTFGEPVETCIKTYDTLFNHCTYYKTNKLDANGNRVLEEPMLNVTEHYVWFVDDISGRTAIGCGFVPFTSNGCDNRTEMWFKWSEITDYLLNNVQNKTLFCYDCRFLNLDNVLDITDEINLDFAEGTSIYTYQASLNINIGLSDAFDLDLAHEDDIQDYILDRQAAKVSNIIDYEKRMFEPTYISDETAIDYDEEIVDEQKLKNLKSIRFNVFLRDRVYNESTGDWSAPDEKYWYSLENNNGKVIFKQNLEENSDKGDLLGSLGFEDNDVVNQSNRLGKTFLRLLFYDTPNRSTQTLLFYSTIYLDTPKQFAKYMRNIASNTKMVDSISNTDPEYVKTVNKNDDLALCCNFTAYDKFNMSGSSEGFYLYLFPDIVDGAKYTEIYMRAELNHSKYGATIPLVCPPFRESNGTLEQDTPRLNYCETGTTVDGEYVNLKKLYNDMYIKLCVKRDYNKNRYVWFWPLAINSNNMVFNLYEPRINETKITK